jgi:uncharacterized membrane protein YfcA
MTVPRALRPRAVYVVIGVASGFFSALFGVGGGTIIVPLLVLLGGFAPMVATGTSLAAIGITALFGMVAFGVLGEVSWADAVVVGGRLAPAAHCFQAPGWTLQRLPTRDRRKALLRMTLALVVLLGFAAGILSGMFGVGGGILFVPTLSLVVGLTHLEAQATSLAAIIPVVAVGAWRQDRYGHVRWKAALAIGLASAIGVVGGVVLADRLSDETLRRLFAGLLVVIAARLAWSIRH